MVNTIVPVWVTIIVGVIVVIGITFTGLFWWHSTRRPRAKTDPEMEEWIDQRRPAPLQRYQIPTMVFQRHEPESHGYFAPVYLVSAENVDAEQAEAGKAAVRSYMTTGLESEPTRLPEKTPSPPPPANADLPGRI